MIRLPAVEYDRYGLPIPPVPGPTDPFGLGWEIRRVLGTRYELLDAEIGERRDLWVGDKLVQLWLMARALQTELATVRRAGPAAS